MSFTEYTTWLTEQVDGFVLEPGCVSIGPYATPTVTPDKPPWEMEWTVLFKDGTYFRAVEHWYRRPFNLGGGGYRKAFSFHYGPANPCKNDEGVPIPSDGYPAIIRIDQDGDWRGPHLHFDGEDHIPQERVENLRISNVDLFAFIRAVIEHRKNRGQVGFDKIMRFKVTK